MMEIYSNLKAAWHTDDIKAIRDGGMIVPHQVYLVLSDLCNQDCHFCTYRSSAGWGSENFGEDTGKGFTMNPNRMIPTEKAMEILDDCAEMGVRAIQLTGGGEPTVHPDCEEIITYALDIGLQVGLISNGSRLLGESTIRRLTWMRISVDAGTMKTYERTRKSKLWPKVMANIEAIAHIDGPVFGASFLVTKENYREVYKFCCLMKTLGVRYVRLAANLTSEGISYYDGLLDEIMPEIERAKSLVSENFRIDDAFERRLSDLRIGRPSQPFCGQQRFSTYIGGDQKVYRCCNTGYTTHGEIGDLKDMRFKDWFDTEARQAFDFDARSCSHCQFIEKNKMLAYLVQKSPKHVHFI